MNEQQKYHYGTGKRKTSVARVRLYSDSGPIVVNGKQVEEAFPWATWQESIGLPLNIPGLT